MTTTTLLCMVCLCVTLMKSTRHYIAATKPMASLCRKGTKRSKRVRSNQVVSLEEGGGGGGGGDDDDDDDEQKVKSSFDRILAEPQGRICDSDKLMAESHDHDADNDNVVDVVEEKTAWQSRELRLVQQWPQLRITNHNKVMNITFVVPDPSRKTSRNANSCNK